MTFDSTHIDINYKIYKKYNEYTNNNMPYFINNDLFLFLSNSEKSLLLEIDCEYFINNLNIEMKENGSDNNTIKIIDSIKNILKKKDPYKIKNNASSSFDILINSIRG